jgi:hypothetical protein
LDRPDPNCTRSEPELTELARYDLIGEFLGLSRNDGQR